MCRVKKMFFLTEEVREIILDVSKGEAKKLEIYAKIMLGINRCGVVNYEIDWSKSVTKNIAGVT